MFTITIPGGEYYRDDEDRFVYEDSIEVKLEHSLISLSKWESKWHKPFLTKDPKSNEEMLDYIRCMCITKTVKHDDFYRLTSENVEEIESYISNPMTATTINKNKKKAINRETITSELIYYWMISLNIPIEFQKWHLNRLFTLIEVCNIKNDTPEKMSEKDILSRNASLNAARKKKYNTKG